ncbi:Membrane progestin receptor gamma [Blattella germanica]|nr:Membrane progestin receptor gamma [Blattella germanica]
MGWSPEKWQVALHQADEIHPHLREIGIITGYRPESATVQQCLGSLIQPTNEMVNFWTHFVAAGYFVFQLIHHCQEATDPVRAGPFIGYLISATACPLVSCLAHAFCAISIRAYGVCYLIDYSTVSIFSFGTGLLYHSYCFPRQFEDTWYARWFMVVCFICSTICTLIACSSRLMHHGRLQEAMRLSAFVVPYIWDTSPLLYRFLVEDGLTAPALFHFLQFFFISLAGFFYGSHLPEILFPGKFDLLGHSHNFLHVFGSLATYMQMRAGIMDMNSRGLMKHSLEGKAAVAAVASFTALTGFIVVIFIIATHKRELTDLKHEDKKDS